jgi:uncharacterized membrane protein YdbT with pleckstrin-like domain
MIEETTVWKGSSSQVINFNILVLSSLIFALLVVITVLVAKPPGVYFAGAACALPLGFGGWNWLVNRSRVYEITSQRLKITEGVFSRKTDELELYRVMDITWVQPFWYRIFGVSNIVLTTNDASTPTVVLQALPKAASIKDDLRVHVEKCRDAKRVRLSELE